MADDKTISNNVVKGPWKRAKTIEPAQTDKMYNDIAWSEEVTESVMIPLIHNLAENGVDVKSDMFVSEVGFMNEIVKSILFRTMGYGHNMTDLIGVLMKTKTESTEDVYSSFDHDLVRQIVEMSDKDLEDEPT